MCGIVGYIGQREASNVLLSGLRRLEYRGYDSAGLSLAGASELHVIKRPGKVATLREAVKECLPPDGAASRVGVAHTRWATHGPPTEANPIVS